MFDYRYQCNSPQVLKQLGEFPRTLVIRSVTVSSLAIIYFTEQVWGEVVNTKTTLFDPTLAIFTVSFLNLQNCII